jgi:eukaryotic-like serine/threonine-protein kinase
MGDLRNCPSRDDLQRMVLGQLPDLAAETIQQHLEHCPKCRSTVDQCVASEALFAAWQASGRVSGVPTKTLQSPVEFLHPFASTLGQGCDQTEPNQGAPSPSMEDIRRLLSPPQSADEIGRLGDFRVLRVLGVGGFAIVFEAEDSHLKRHVALKLMHAAIAATPGAADRFMREAQSAAALKHDGVVTIYQVGKHGETPFIALELLQGETLENYLIRKEPLEIREVVRIGREIASGLAAAHARGLLHRDIKPANIWLERPAPASDVETESRAPSHSRDGENAGKVKILDFGCAKLWSVHSTISHPGHFIGTPAYTAPERLSGGAVDPRADLFSLGCVLYRMATGKRPFGGDDLLSAVRALALEEPAPFRATNGRASQLLSELVGELLAKSPAGRPPDARAVLERLEAIERSISETQVADNSATNRLSTDGVRGSQQKTRLVGISIAVAATVATAYFLGAQFSRIAANNRPVTVDSLEDGPASATPLESRPTGAASIPPISGVEASSELDRGAASWVLSHGGSVTVRFGNSARPAEIESGHALPAMDFQLTNVRLQKGAWTDTDLEHLRGLTHVVGLVLSGKQITGAGLVNLEGLRELKTLALTNTSVTDDGLKHIQDLTRLESVVLDGTQVTDAGLEHLEGLKHLRELNLNWTRVTDAGLAKLEGSPQLDTLRLGDTRVSDRGVAQLHGLTRLRILNLTALPVTDAGLASLQSLKNLQHLVLDKTRVTDAGLVSLKSFAKLYSLYLGETGVTDAGLADLKDLPNLRILGLYGLRGVTDAAVPRLVQLANLEEVDLRETRLSIKGFGALKARVPKLRISWSDPDKARNARSFSRWRAE